MCAFLKRNCLGLQKFIPLTQSPLVFASRVVGTYLPGSGILGWGVWCEAGAPRCQDIPPKFLCITCEWESSLFRVWPLLPVSMNVVSLILSLSDFHSTWFLMVLSDGCCIFSCNLNVVVHRGTPCPPTSPSCLEAHQILIQTHKLYKQSKTTFITFIRQLEIWTLEAYLMLLKHYCCWFITLHKISW